MGFKWLIGVLAASAVMMTSCDTIEDNRLPYRDVYLPFNSIGMWNAFGISGAMDYRQFIYTPNDRVPVNFPYTVSMSTGYGGLLLVGDVYGNPVAFDLACPVEASPTIRVMVDYEHNDAYCPVCGSSYDIFSGWGNPTGGRAAELGWGLTRYRVVPNAYGSYSIVN